VLNPYWLMSPAVERLTTFVRVRRPASLHVSSGRLGHSSWFHPWTGDQRSSLGILRLRCYTLPGIYLQQLDDIEVL